MIGVGTRRFRGSVLAARQKGTESTTAAGISLARRVIAPLSEAINTFVEEARSGKPGRRHTAAQYLEAFDPDVAAYIVAKAVLDTIGQRCGLLTTINRVSLHLERELKYRVFEQADPDRYKATQEWIRRSASQRYQHTVLTYAMHKSQKDIPWEPWPNQAHIHVGQKCVDLLVESTGIVECFRMRVSKKKTKWFIQATEETTQWISQLNDHCEMLCPELQPMVVPPRDWTSLYDGGYLLQELLPITMVTTRNKDHLAVLEQEPMPVVYESVNVIQRTAWQINKPVLETLKALWKNGSTTGGLPPYHNIDLPNKPHDIADNEEARRAWKREAAFVHRENHRFQSKRVQIAKVIFLAEKFADEPEIYFPHKLDWRGRVYAIPMFLNPQGADWAKALLQFAHGKPLGDDNAVGWLAIHGSNLFGEDKVSLSDRIQWVDDHEADILATASDPYDNNWWTTADKPWQFLAWCFEWAGFRSDGYDFVSHLPIALDGSCNGLQHFAAMSRDQEGGRAVNLVPSDTPNDVYQIVSDNVVDQLGRAPKDSTLATQWLDYGVTRDVTKRPVMILPYGGTVHAFRRYIQEHIKKKSNHGMPSPWGHESFKPANFLTPYVWGSIGQVVSSAKWVMTWLQQLSRVAAREDLAVSWVTPAGFPVVHYYSNMADRRVKTQMGDTIILYRLNEPSPGLNTKRQAQAISPNFVHSLDAAALQLTVCRVSDLGVTSFSMVHDSYGTLAADTEVLFDHLRDVFVTMYEENDVLEQIYQSVYASLTSPKNQADLPEPPAKGELDISLVRESEYFFA